MMNEHYSFTGYNNAPAPRQGSIFFYIKEGSRNINVTPYSKMSALRIMETQDIVNRLPAAAWMHGSRDGPEKVNFIFLFPAHVS